MNRVSSQKNGTIYQIKYTEKNYMYIAGLVTGNYHYRKLPLPHDIFITATITGTLNFIFAVTINLPI